MATICSCDEAATGFNPQAEYPYSTTCITPGAIYCVNGVPVVLPSGKLGTSCTDAQEARLDMAGAPIAFSASQVLNSAPGFVSQVALLNNALCRPMKVFAFVTMRARIATSATQGPRFIVTLTAGGGSVATDVVSADYGSISAQDCLVSFQYCLPTLAVGSAVVYGLTVSQDLTAGSGADALTGILAFNAAARYIWFEST